MKKTALFFIAGLSLGLVCMVSWADVPSVARRAPEHIERPFLLSPTSEEVVLTGSDTLEFKWRTDLGHYVGKNYYDFRIYKGYDMRKGTLIFQEKAPPHTGSIEVSTDLFQNGEIYTWSVRYVVGINKSDSSFRSFKAVK